MSIKPGDRLNSGSERRDHVFMCSWLSMMLFTEIRGSKAGNGVEDHGFNHGVVACVLIEVIPLR